MQSSWRKSLWKTEEGERPGAERWTDVLAFKLRVEAVQRTADERARCLLVDSFSLDVSGMPWKEGTSVGSLERKSHVKVTLFPEYKCITRCGELLVS